MKALMYKLLALTLIVLMLCSLCICTYAADIPLIRAYQTKSYIGISGNAGIENAGYEASVMLVKKGATPSEESIGYIGQSRIDTNGNYRFEFSFDGLEYENNVVSNYDIVLNVNGTSMEKTITEAKVISDMITFESFDFSAFGKAITEIDSIFKDIDYLLIIAYYDADNTLLKVQPIKRFSGDEDIYSYNNDIPENASYARGFVWEDTVKMFPLTTPQTFDFEEYAAGRKAQFLTIAPGRTESERNFAWYDIGGVEEVRLQYVVKNTGTAADFESADAKTVTGTCGPTDVGDTYNGTNNGAGKEAQVFRHSWDHTWAKATATDLKPGKTYVYRVGDALGWCEGIYEFKTDSAPKEGFSFIIFSDEHAEPADEYAQPSITQTREKAIETCPDASFIFALGDNVDVPWRETAYKEYFEREKMESIPLATVPGGTHDMMITEFRASLFDYHFNMPNQCSANDDESYSGYYENVGGNYWYLYGDLLVIGTTYNAYEKADVQKAYIEKAVSEAEKVNPDIKWKIWCTHLPVYEEDAKIDLTNYRNKMYFWEGDDDFVKDNGIDVVFTGHMHQTYRSYQMYSGERVYDETETNSVTDPKGTVYISHNTTGRQAYECNYDDAFVAFSDPNTWGSSRPGFTDKTMFYTHFSTVDIKKDASGNDVFEYKLYKNEIDKATKTLVNSEVIDTYTITKTK